MKPLSDYFQKYRGKTAAFIAAGPSFMEAMNGSRDLPSDFNHVIKFGLNYTYRKIGEYNLDFIMVQEIETYDIVKEQVDNTKLIIPASPGLNKHGTAERVKVTNDEAIGYNLQDPLKNKKEDLPRKFTGLTKNCPFFSYTSTSQPAVHIMAYMGFSKIYLLGVDYKLYDNGKIHFESGVDERYDNQKMNALARIKEGDSFLMAKLNRLYQIRFVNLGYGESYG